MPAKKTSPPKKNVAKKILEKTGSKKFAIDKSPAAVVSKTRTKYGIQPVCELGEDVVRQIYQVPPSLKYGVKCHDIGEIVAQPYYGITCVVEHKTFAKPLYGIKSKSQIGKIKPLYATKCKKIIEGK